MRLTKAAALAKAGYVPVIGRPKKEQPSRSRFVYPYQRPPNWVTRSIRSEGDCGEELGGS